MFGDDIESAVLFSVNCSGSESELSECEVSESGVCPEHSAAVICQGLRKWLFYVIQHLLIIHRLCDIMKSLLADAQSDNCSHGDVWIASRIDDTTTLSSEGRLEVCVNGVWGTVCDLRFGTGDAEVACKQMGYDGEGK